MIGQVEKSRAVGAFAVRPAVPSDLKPIGQLQEAAILGLGISDYDPTRAAAWVRFQLSTRNNVLKDGPFFVAERHGRIVACGGWRADLQRRDAVWIRAVFVLPEFARRGACRQVMDAVEVSARIEGRDHFLHGPRSGHFLFQGDWIPGPGASHLDDRAGHRDRASLDDERCGCYSGSLKSALSLQHFEGAAGREN